MFAASVIFTRLCSTTLKEKKFPNGNAIRDYNYFSLECEKSRSGHVPYGQMIALGGDEDCPF